jgi:Tfp pilus assembly protein PilV
MIVRQLKKEIHLNKGLSLVEVIVGSAIIVMTLIALIGAAGFYLRAGMFNTERVQMTYLAQEGVEAIRFMRDSGWTANIVPITTGTSFNLELNSGAWIASSTTIVLDGKFERTVVLTDVYRRNSDSDIVDISSPDSNSLDTDARRVTVHVEKTGGSRSVELISYITNLFDN